MRFYARSLLRSLFEAGFVRSYWESSDQRANCDPMAFADVILARHFDINANEILQLAGWPAMEAFSLTNPDLQNPPPEAASVALDIARIKDPGTRKQGAEAIRTLLAKYFD